MHEAARCRLGRRFAGNAKRYAWKSDSNSSKQPDALVGARPDLRVILNLD